MTEGQSQRSTVITADKGRKLVFDNFDYKQQVHSMTEQHQNIDVHWVTHLSVENRGDAVMQMENGVCLPTRHEHHLQRENYITLTERATVEIPCLACLKRVVCKHIPRQYSKEMAEKSEMVLHSTIY